MKLKPYSIDVHQNVLEDLRLRLINMRWPDEIQDAEWSYGTNLIYLQQLVKYWQKEYDWREEERKLNRLNHYKASVNGLGIHFIYERGKSKNSIPLLLSHGYPDSFVRMLKLIPMLTDPGAYGGDPEQSFDVIIPSLPGMGFSDKPWQKGFTTKDVADIFAKLMHDVLGYEQFAAHGGDWGSSVTEQLAVHHAHLLSAIHLTEIPFWRLFGIKQKNLSKVEQDYMKRGQQWQMKEGAYNIMLATKPQTVTYALNDSPVGLAAWIIEKFQAWCDCDEDLEKSFTKDELLTNIMIYWVTQTIGSAGRYYYETQHKPFENGQVRVEVPTGVAIFPKDLVPSPREFGERFYNIRSWTEMPEGGHFAAMEAPELLAADMRKFFFQEVGVLQEMKG